MTFNQRKLDRSVIQASGIFNKYIYETDDTIEQIQEAGYFRASRFAQIDSDITNGMGWRGGIIEAKCSDGYIIGQIGDDGETLTIAIDFEGAGFQLFVQSNGDEGTYATETARDTYFTANPTELARLDEDRFLIIFITDSGEYQQRVDGSWLSVTSLVRGPRGASGAETDFSGITANHIPAIGANSEPFDSGFVSEEPVVSGLPRNLRTAGSVRTGIASIQLEDQFTLTGGGESMVFTAMARNQHFYPLQLLLSSASTTGPQIPLQGPALNAVIQSEFDTQITNPDFTFTASGGQTPQGIDGEIIYGFRVRLPDANPVENVRAQVFLQGQSSAFWSEVFPLITPSGPNNEAVLDFQDTGPFNLLVGETYRITIARPDGTDVILMGNSSGTIYYGLNLRFYSLVDVITDQPASQSDWDETDTNAFSFIKNKPDFSDVDSEISALDGRVRTLENTAFNSGRSFIRFNDGFTITSANIGQYEDKNILYTARNDKPLDSATRPDVFLPDDTAIAASGEAYPITFEFTHLGGSVTSTTLNLVRLFESGVLAHTLQRNQVVVAIKDAPGQQYRYLPASFDPNDTILPTGVFNLKTETPIDDISNIATDLAGVSIIVGDAYLVVTGGAWSGLQIPNNSVLVALKDGASTADNVNNIDWLLLTSTEVDVKTSMLLANFEQDGARFIGSRRVRVDPANVSEFRSIVTGTPETLTIGGNTQGFNRSIIFAGRPIQFSDLTGGQLTMTVDFSLTLQDGFAPEYLSIELEYPNGVKFTFPVTNVDPNQSGFIVTIDIPPIDYTPILNQNATVTLNYNFRGARWLGSYTITNIVNTDVGALNAPIRQLAQVEAAAVEQRLNGQINRIASEIDDENSALGALTPRLFTPVQVPNRIPYTRARFENSSGSDAFPSNIGLMQAVSSDNPRFIGGGTALFIAAEGGGTYALTNITTDSEIPLDSSLPNVELGESLTFEGSVYFVYRVTGLTSGHTYEVDTVSSVLGYRERIDIANNTSRIERIEALDEHGIFNLDDEVIHVFENNLSVDEETTPNTVATNYNRNLSPDNTQKVFYDTVSTSGGFLPSSTIKDNMGTSTERRKLLYISTNNISQGLVVLRANDDAGTTTDLITFDNNQFIANQFVPAQPASSHTSTEYVSESNGAGQSALDPIDIAAGRRRSDGGWEAVDTEVSVVRNIPTNNETVTVTIDGNINGNDTGTATLTVPFGGSSSLTYVTDDSFNTGIRFTVRYSNNNSQIDIQLVHTEANNFALDGAHFAVLVSYQQTRNVPAIPATVRQVNIGTLSLEQSNVFAMKDVGGNLVIQSDEATLDTGYSYSALFGAGGDGFFQTPLVTSNFFNYRVIGITSTVITDLENHSTLPQFGLFETQYTHSSVLDLTTQLSIEDSGGNKHNALSLVQTVSGKLIRADIVSDGSGGYELSFTEI